MATFVIETYLSRARAGDLDRAIADLRAAVARAASTATGVRHVRSFYIHDDEMAFHIVEARSVEVVGEVARRAGLTPDRIVEAATG